MTAIAAEVHRGIVNAWTEHLDMYFKSYWSVADRAKFLTLNEDEAAPGTPFPYAVYEQLTTNPQTRMSGNAGFKKNTISTRTFLIHIFAGPTTISAKAVAEELATEVLAVYGGHPTKRPLADLHSYGVLHCKLSNDYSIREMEHRHRWVLEYSLLVDQPYFV